MGLTIHYKLTSELTNPQDVRQVIETVRQYALDMPFKEVSEIKEFDGDDTDHRTGPEDDRWLKIQSKAHISVGKHRLMISPQHVIAFSTWPGEGCEPANFGLSKYPAFVPSPDGRGQLPTKLDGWSWTSFCKTQYASDPKCGGIENYLRCHLAVVKLLDFIKATGFVTVEVRDEAEFWDKRDLALLAKEVGEWNELVAGMVSEFRLESKDVHAPITTFPNFEHLEAKGLERLADLRRRLKPDKP